MLYFCKRDLPNDIDPAELMKLNEFKAQMKTRVFFTNTQLCKNLNETYTLIWTLKLVNY